MINKLWEKYDDDNSGELDFSEIKCYVKDVYGKIPNDIVQRVFNKVDEDGSGAIGKDEMVDFMNLIQEEARLLPPE